MGLEAGDHLAGVHPELDDLQCHPPTDGLLLLGEVDDGETAFPVLVHCSCIPLLPFPGEGPEKATLNEEGDEEGVRLMAARKQLKPRLLLPPADPSGESWHVSSAKSVGSILREMERDRQQAKFGKGTGVSGEQRRQQGSSTKTKKRSKRKPRSR